MPLVGVAAWLLAAAWQGQQPAPPPPQTALPRPSPAQQPPPAPRQPIPYSHKTHLALGLQCASCHGNADPGEFMGFPAESFCMGCHQAIKADSPHIEKLAAAARDQKPVPWVRVYQLPKYIYFSHRVHTAAGTSCETCHGAVREREVIAQEVLLNMRSCMACHAASKARNDCATCHEER